MSCAIYVMLEGFDSLPYGHVDDDAVVIVRAKIGSVAFGRLQPPNKSGTTVGESVDLIKSGYKPGHDRIIKRRLHASDINLGDVKLGHMFSLFNASTSAPRRFCLPFTPQL